MRQFLHILCPQTGTKQREKLPLHTEHVRSAAIDRGTESEGKALSRANSLATELGVKSVICRRNPANP